MLKHSLLFLICFALNSFSADEKVVHHPVPKKPIYVGEEYYASLKKELPTPPARGSSEQKNDEQELFTYQKTRQAEDCDKARSEILVSLSNFFGSPKSPISKVDIERLSPFFEQIRNDADYFIQKLKKDFPRQRPFLYLKGLEPCVQKEVTGAYPSGHAVLSKLFALVLNDLYPSQHHFLEARAKQIGDHRVLVGMHHRSDIEVGRQLAILIYEQFKKSPKFRSDFERNRKDLSL